jgi:hypothetical protein
MRFFLATFAFTMGAVSALNSDDHHAWEDGDHRALSFETVDLKNRKLTAPCSNPCTQAFSTGVSNRNGGPVLFPGAPLGIGCPDVTVSCTGGYLGFAGVDRNGHPTPPFPRCTTADESFLTFTFSAPISYLSMRFGKFDFLAATL